MGYPVYLLSRSRKTVDRRTSSVAALIASASWVTWDATADIALEAQAGDELVASINGIWGGEAYEGYIDIATWVSGAGVHWFGTGEPTTTTGYGISGWYGVLNVISVIGGNMSYTVVAGDVVAGLVTCRLRVRSNNAFGKTLFNSAIVPFQWSLENRGPQDT